jgi:hypothetical protein
MLPKPIGTILKSKQSTPMSIPPNKIRVLLLYDNIESGVYATEFFDQITQMLDKEFPIKFDIWNFESIYLKMLSASVYHAALNADIIAFAIDDQDPISNKILEWCESWLPFKQPHSCALIGIVTSNVHKRTINLESPNLQTLRELANHAKLDFFTQKTFLTDPVAI